MKIEDGKQNCCPIDWEQSQEPALEKLDWRFVFMEYMRNQKTANYKKTFYSHKSGD